MSGYSPAKKTTAKSQNRGDARRVVAQGPANPVGPVGGRARRATARSGIGSAPAQAVPAQAGAAQAGASDTAGPPGAEPPAQRTYVAREHLRKDIGSRVLVLDLTAPDAPPGAPAPSRDPDGALLQFVAECVTHRERKYLCAYAPACRAAKASHHWCPGCKTELARHHRLHSTASAQSSPKR
jgi:hypothetical protein